MSAISDKIRDAKDLTEITAHVDEWGVDLLLISPTVQERLDMIEQYTIWTEDVDGNRIANLDTASMGPALVIACSHDPENRERAFEPADIAMLKAKNGAVVDRVSKLCAPLVGFAQEGATEAGKDDSSTTPNADTESGSLVDSAVR